MTDSDRIKMLERRVADLERIILSMPAREAVTMQPWPMRIAQLGEEDMGYGEEKDCTIFKQNSDGTYTSTEQTQKAWDYLLTDGYKIPAGSRLVLQREPHSKLWIVTNANRCQQLIVE